ncbi:VanZ family protein [Halopseudomonas sp. Lyrl_26]|uniref:VanZ family protein n=1 Tax=Halopseudomonas sp. Lyrl_26 TaxID=3110923 RepID=UPI003F80116B
MLIAISRHWARYRLAYRVLFFSVLLLGIYLGMRPAPPPVPFKFSMIDAVYHAGGLFVCTLLSYPAFPRWGRWWRAGFMFAVGLAVEYVQSFHPTRSPDIHDIYANTAGVAAGMLIATAVAFSARRNQ